MSGTQDKVAGRQKWSRRALRWLAIYGVLPYAAIVLLLAVFQRSLIYGPVRDRALSDRPPAIRGALVEPISFSTDDHLKLHGWHLSPAAGPGDPKAARRVSDRPVFLFFCGNGGHRGWRTAEFQVLTGLECEIICFDYRGYGENEGTPSEAAIAEDAHAIWKHLTAERKTDPRRIIIFGESLGGGVATRLASELSERGSPPAGLVLRSTFTSLVDAAAWHFPWVPVRCLLLDRYPSLERIGQVTCPILVLHGRRDAIVPFEQGQRLFAAAPEKSSSGVAKRFFALESADHNDVLLMEGDAFRDELESFLGRTHPRLVKKQLGFENMLAELVRRRTYFPDRVDDLSPGRLRLPTDRIQGILAQTEDGFTLKGWHFLAEGCRAVNAAAWNGASTAGRPLVLFFSGNGGNRAYRVSEAEVLTHAGADVFLFDYRGYGDNPGTPSEQGLMADARAAWHYATHERHVEPRQIILYGESLGGAVATRLAAALCAAGTSPGGLILRSTFSTLADAARHLFPLLPVNILLHERYASSEWIGKVTCPILMLHGLRDAVVPHYLGRRLFDAAPKESGHGVPIEFVDLPHADHNDVLETDGELLQEAIDSFVARISPARPALEVIDGYSGK